MNLHVKELGDVIMWTIGNFEGNEPKFAILTESQQN